VGRAIGLSAARSAPASSLGAPAGLDLGLVPLERQPDRQAGQRRQQGEREREEKGARRADRPLGEEGARADCRLHKHRVLRGQLAYSPLQPPD
jgi:hypothetical protein